MKNESVFAEVGEIYADCYDLPAKKEESMNKVNRIKKLQRYLEEHGPDGLLIEEERNRQYLTYAHIWEGTLLVTAAKSFLLVDFRYYEMAKKSTRDCEVILCQDIDETLEKLLESENIRSLAVERAVMPVTRAGKIGALLKNGRIQPEICADGIVKEFRKIKDDYEISCLRKAQKITDEAYGHILQKVSSGMKESEVRVILGSCMIEHGSEDYNIGYIASSGAKTSMPHGGTGNRAIQDGDLLMIDFGARVDGYTSDCTRTFGIGHVTDEQRHIYEIVKAAQEKALKSIVPGMTGRQVDGIARDYIEANGFGGCFGHGLGHSIGLDGHENPRFRQDCREVMREGMVMTVEPGIYLENRFGVRIEDMGMVTASGFEDFTGCTRELIVV